MLVILLQFAIKTFDLVRALTGGGPGISTTLPALVVYDFMFQRGQLGRGSAAAVLLLLSLVVVLLPYDALRALAGAAGARQWVDALRPGRWLIYAILCWLRAVLLLPLVVVVLNSFRTARRSAAAR